MARRLDRSTLVIASHNHGKASEVADLLRPWGLRMPTATELALDEPVEDGDTFVANASLKARAAAKTTAEVAISDDSGLVVPALDGAPGVLSARWGGPERDYDRAMEAIHEALGDADRAAFMVCALAVAWPDGHIEAFEGRVPGRLIWPPRGELGFGYEPMFVPEGASRTYGEMPRLEKHADDPRARAFAQLRALLGPQSQ